MKDPLEKYKPVLKELVFETPSDHKKICCTSCNEEVPADNINIHDKIAKCSSCNVVFSFEAALSSFKQKASAKQEVIRPEGIDIFHFQNELDISVGQPGTILEGLGIGVLPFLTIIFTVAYFKAKITLIFPLITWILTAALIVNLFNRAKHKVHITVADGYLSLFWRPKKLQKDKHYKVEEIDQVYVRGSTGVCSVYMVVNGIDGQKHVRLITNLDSLSKARYLEQEIEAHLGIVDREIPEEAR